jgi:hypothetical protein
MLKVWDYQTTHNHNLVIELLFVNVLKPVDKLWTKVDKGCINFNQG